MAYKVVGTGPEHTEPQVREAETAKEALGYQDQLARLCGRAEVQDERGRALTTRELREKADQEHQVERSRLRRRNAHKP